MKILAVIFAFATLGAWDQGRFVLAVLLGLVTLAVFISAIPRKPQWERVGTAGIYRPKK